MVYRCLCLAFAAVVLLAAPRPLVAQAVPNGEPIALDELVVTAAGREQTRINAPASITVISSAELARKRTSSLAEALADVEGVDVGDTRGKTGGLSVGMRGMPSDYTLVLIDGRRQNTAGNVTPNGFTETATSFLPPVSAIERVEIIRGPMATLYGSDAMGGVINIITRKVGSAWRGSFTSDATLQQEAGFGNAYSGGGEVNGPILRGLLALSLRGSVMHRRSSQLEPTGEFGESTEISRRGPSPTEADVSTVGGRLALTPGRTHGLTLDVERARQAYDNSAAQLGTLDRPDGRPPTFNGYSPELRFNRDETSLTHEWSPGGARLSTSLMRNTTETIGRTLPSGTPGGPPGSGAPNKPAGDPRTLRSTSLVLDSKLSAEAAGHLLTVGGQLWDAEMIDAVALEPFTHRQWSLFAEDEWRLLAPLALTLGVRRDDHSAFGGAVSPRAYLVWNASSAWTFKGGVSAGYKTPRVEQLMDGIIGFTGQGRNATIGSPGLKPETSRTTELGAYFSGASGLFASVSLFDNQFRDKIAAGTPIANCTFAGAPNRPGCVSYGAFPLQESFSQSVNVDRATTRGLEASARLPLLEIWSVQGNYTFTESEQESGENEGMPLTNTPRHMLNGSLRLAPDSRWSAWARGEYRSERARRTSVAANPAYDALGDYRAFSLYHLGAGYEMARGVSLNATVYNLLGTDFLRYAAYSVAPTAANPSGVLYTNLYNNHQEGRRLWLSTTVRF